MSKERFTTPFAECLYPFLQQASHDPEGQYEDVFKITLVLKKEHKELLDQIVALYKAAGGTVVLGGKGHPIKFHKNEAGQVIDHEYEVTFKTKAEFVDHIMCFDAKGNVLWREKNFVANGSIVRVNWTYANYNNKGNKGVSLFLNGVQVKELIEWQGASFESLGFDEVDGYEAGDDVEVAFPPSEPLPEDLEGQDGSPVEDDLPF